MVAKAAAENLIPCILELGGKSPTIIDGGDLSVVARRLVQTKFFNSGQTCVAPDYCLVREELKDELVEKLKGTIKAFFSEKAQESRWYQRIINEFHVKRLQEYLETHRGQLVVGGEVDVEDRYISPTVVLSPALDSPLMVDEIFGPILPLILYKNQDEVVRFINSRPKPLALYYYGVNERFKQRLLIETSSGAVCINDSVFHMANAQLPFGGVGNSGYGSYNAQRGFDQFCHLKPVLEKNLSIDPSVRYPPYDAQKMRIFNLLLQFGHIEVDKVQQAGIVLIFLLVLLAVYKVGVFNTGQDL